MGSSHLSIACVVEEDSQFQPMAKISAQGKVLPGHVWSQVQWTKVDVVAVNDT